MHNIWNDIGERILVLDGGFGSLAMGYADLEGPLDALPLSHPDVVDTIHRQYLAAGADIISTASMNANAVALAEYDLQERAYDIARASAEIARRAANEFERLNPAKCRYVGGSVGPTGKTASIATDMTDTSRREISFDTLREAYRTQIRGLVDGGVDIVQLETFFDTLNAKAAIMAASDVFDEIGRELPIIVSGTLTPSGRTLSGQTVEAFYTSVRHAKPLAVSLNCSFGAAQILPWLERLASVAECPVCVYPNAGLPNAEGGYDETAGEWADMVEEYLRRGLVNIVGGCCGTTPAHIALLASRVSNYRPRPIPVPAHRTTFSGLEMLEVTLGRNFVNIGERTNVSGSARFARLIREGNYAEGLSVARAQIEAGAQIIDLCFDAPMVDGVGAMERFTAMASAEPDIAAVPMMLDSSSWETLEAGLKLSQGKSIVNSISLKSGEAEFLARALYIYRYGAAAVVMLFDERGQADTYERKIEVAGRAYRLLTENGFPAEDIIFDPNILAVGTGIAEHDDYGRAFIEATKWIRDNCPGVNISGGVSNLSFAFRGNEAVRRALHSVFLYWATRAGMTMGIVNPAQLDVYEDIEEELRELATDVVLNRRADASERLAAYAERTRDNKDAVAVKSPAELQTECVGERIRLAMLRGIDEYIEADALQAYEEFGNALRVIDELFMPAMERVGEAFGDGRMFLPQVVKSARVMRRGVGALLPYVEHHRSSKRRRVVLATVKGDVHDIGKNIVSVVLSCNGYEIDDVGVMAERATIVEHARVADAVGLSALITPSLDEMVGVVKELERAGIRIPVLIGGATTSAIHTAVKLAPEYSGVVVYARDASDDALILGRLFGEDGAEYEAEVRMAQATLREQWMLSRRPLRTLSEARKHRRPNQGRSPVPRFLERRLFDDFPVSEAERYIDWRYFLAAWRTKPDTDEATRLIGDAKRVIGELKSERSLRLRGVAQIFRAHSEGDDIVVDDAGVRLPMLRNQRADMDENLCLADFLAIENDYLCAFTVSGGVGLSEMTERCRAEGDEYGAMLAKLVADRLTEGFCEAVHLIVRREMWGYETGRKHSVDEILAERYRGRRFAFGYPACPDHSLKREVFGLLDVERLCGLKLNENDMIEPGESLCGVILPVGEYFDVGRIDDEQRTDYEHRLGRKLRY